MLKECGGLGNTAQVLVIDEVALIRLGVITLLHKDSRFKVCGETHQTSVARLICAQQRPELIVIGPHTFDKAGIALVRDLGDIHPAAKTMLILNHSDVHFLKPAIAAGAQGCVWVKDDLLEITTGLERLLMGEYFSSRSLSDSLLKHISGKNGSNYPIDAASLSSREIQVLMLMGRGSTTANLATELMISVKTVETYQRRLKEKLHLHTYAELQREAARWMQQKN